MPEPRDGELTSNGLRLTYRDWGGSGQPVVLLHGLASNAGIWNLVAPALAQDARVVALNQRGHGASDRPESGYTFEDVTADLAGALDALSIEKPVVVGHSWGANVAASFALSHPERVAGIGLLDGGVYDLSSNMTWDVAEQTMAPPKLAGMPRSQFLERARSFDASLPWSPAVEAAIMGNFEVREDDTIAPWLTFERHMDILRAIYGYHPAELLPSVRAPVLVMLCIRGLDSEADGRKRAAFHRVSTLLADGRVVWFEDSIHDVPLQRPGLVAATIGGFIEEIAARGA